MHICVQAGNIIQRSTYIIAYVYTYTHTYNDIYINIYMYVNAYAYRHLIYFTHNACKHVD